MSSSNNQIVGNGHSNSNGQIVGNGHSNSTGNSNSNSFVESVLENFNQDQLGMLIMKDAIGLLVNQHKPQIVSMTIDPPQLELILDDFCLWPTQ